MKTRASFPTPSPEGMRRLIEELTPAERATLKDPEFMTEDEADLIVSDRRMKEPGRSIPAEEVLAELGYTRRHRRSA